MAPNKNTEKGGLPHFIDSEGGHHFPNVQTALRWLEFHDRLAGEYCQPLHVTDDAEALNAVPVVERSRNILPERLRALGALPLEALNLR